jgi:ABC-type antimicrobial peptide transport system permease subunit
MRIIMLVLAFLFLGAFFIISNNDLRLSDSVQAKTFYEMYSSWFNGLVSNTVAITGNAVKMNWLPSQ